MENCSDTPHDSRIPTQALLPAARGCLWFSVPGTAHPFLSSLTEMYNDATFIIYPTEGVYFCPHLGHVQQERNLFKSRKIPRFLPFVVQHEEK